MATIIKPTVGRVVWFYVYTTTDGSHKKEPLAAHVAKVHSDSCVNLMIISEAGVPFAASSIRLIQADEEVPKADYCTWMPYQIGQASKTEEAERKLAEKA